MGLFDGKKGLILGVANDRSIAWAIAKKIMAEGGECGFTHLPDSADDARKKNRRRVEKCFDKLESDTSIKNWLVDPSSNSCSQIYLPVISFPQLGNDTRDIRTRGMMNRVLILRL